MTLKIKDLTKKDQNMITRNDAPEKELKFMTVPFKVKELEEDEKYYHFKGYGSTFGNVDRGDDIVQQGAFVDSLNEMKAEGDVLPALWQHDSDEPVGIYLEVYEDSKGLFVHGIMPKDDDFVKGRVIPQMKIGSVSKLSIGYTILDFDININEETDDRTWTLKKLKLWEVSLVTIPMNNFANITEVKGVVLFSDTPITDREKEWDEGAAQKRIKEWAGASDGLVTKEIQNKYKRAFLYCNEDEPDSFEAYKLQFADVVDGELKAVPGGVFSVAGAVRGKRGGVNIPGKAEENVIRNINKYYKKMDLESPFESKECFRIDDIKALDECLLEDLFKTGVRVSNKTAKTLVSFIKSGLQRDVVEPDQWDADAWKNFGEAINNTKEEI